MIRMRETAMFQLRGRYLSIGRRVLFFILSFLGKPTKAQGSWQPDVSSFLTNDHPTRLPDGLCFFYDTSLFFSTEFESRDAVSRIQRVRYTNTHDRNINIENVQNIFSWTKNPTKWFGRPRHPVLKKVATWKEREEKIEARVWVVPPFGSFTQHFENLS